MEDVAKFVIFGMILIFVVANLAVYKDIRLAEIEHQCPATTEVKK